MVNPNFNATRQSSEPMTNPSARTTKDDYIRKTRFLWIITLRSKGTTPSSTHRPLSTTIMPFNFANRYALITYAQCDGLDPFKVVNLLGDMGGECIIGQEQHEDGGTHLHAFVDFGKRKQFKDERKLDIDGHHPNIQPFTSGQPADMYDYAIKDGNIVAGGLERPETTSGRKRKGGCTSAERQAKMQRVLDATTEEELDAALMDQLGEKYITSYNAVKAFKADRLRPKPKDYTSPDGLSVNTENYPELKEWVAQNLDGFEAGSKFF